MFKCTLKSWCSRFRESERGTVTVAALITLPILIWAVGATYEFFDLYRYNSSRDKATYTIADMISREGGAITPTYLDNAKIVFDTIADDNGANSLRVSIIKYDTDTEKYSVKWSRVRGTAGPKTLVPLVTEDIKDAHDRLPIMGDGEELIVVDSLSIYPPLFEVGLGDDMEVRTDVMTSPRFFPQINWADS